jgi:hypothetical protein
MLPRTEPFTKAWKTSLARYARARLAHNLNLALLDGESGLYG